MAFGKGGAGHAGGFFRDRRDDVRVERHARRPSAEGVQTRQTSRSVLCHSPLARSPFWREGNLYRYFVLQKYFLYQPSKKTDLVADVCVDITFGYLNIKVYSILEYEELINRTIKTYFRVGQQYPNIRFLKVATRAESFEGICDGRSCLWHGSDARRLHSNYYRKYFLS